MSLQDFESLTPSEFSAVASKWGTWREGIERAEWERTRTHASLVLQLFSRRRLRPGDVLRFPWDGNQEKTKGGKGRAPESTPERMMEVLRRCGGSAAVTSAENGIEADKGRDDKRTAQDGADGPSGEPEEQSPKAFQK